MQLTCYGFLFIFQCETAAIPPVVVCPQLTDWPKAYQARLADEIERMPAGSVAERALREHIQMRERARRCRQRRS